MELAQVLAGGGGVVVGNALALLPPITLDHDKVPAGYFWPAVSRARATLLCVSAIEVVVGLGLTLLIGPWHVGPGHYPALVCTGVILGFTVGLYSYLGEKAYLHTLTARNTNSTTRRVLRASVSKYRSFRRGIQEVIEDDNDAWQERRTPWKFDVGARKIGRRIRIVFAKKKLEVSTARMDPKFMYYGPNIDPGQLFYPLVRHLGRNELRRLLSSQPTPPWPRMQWDGSENRRCDGSIRDREDESTWPARRSDDPQLIAEIRQGTATGEPPLLPRTQQYLVRNVAGMASSGHYDDVPWRETKTRGIRWLPIELNAEGRGTETDAVVLIQMDPGCQYPRHEHLGEEDVLILSGGYRDDRGEYRAGQFVRSPPGSVHTPVALGDRSKPIGPDNEACTMFAIARGGTRILKREEANDADEILAATTPTGNSSTANSPMNYLADSDARHISKIAPWKEPDTSEYLIEASRLGDEEEQRILKCVQRFGICQVRLGASTPTQARLQAIENGIGYAADTQNDFKGKVKAIEPRPGVEANTGDSAKELAPHVDGTQHDKTPAILVFQYVVGPQFGGHSTFVDLAYVLSELPPDRLEYVVGQLSRKDCARLEKKGFVYQGPLITPVSGGRALAFRLRFDAVLTVHPECQRAFDELAAAALGAPKMVFKPREGDIVLFDNWRLLHGRLEVEGRINRIHDRMWIKDLHTRHEPNFMLGVRPIAPAMIASVEAANNGG